MAFRQASAPESPFLGGDLVVRSGAAEPVEAEWEGGGTFIIGSKVPDSPGDRVTLRSTYTFHEAGTYFRTLRVTS